MGKSIQAQSDTSSEYVKAINEYKIMKYNYVSDR